MLILFDIIILYYIVRQGLRASAGEGRRRGGESARGSTAAPAHRPLSSTRLGGFQKRPAQKSQKCRKPNTLDLPSESCENTVFHESCHFLRHGYLLHVRAGPVRKLSILGEILGPLFKTSWSSVLFHKLSPSLSGT